jgi:hypothetical protein
MCYTYYYAIQAIAGFVLHIVLHIDCSTDVLISVLWRCSERIIYIMKTSNIVKLTMSWSSFADDNNAKSFD